MNNFATLSAERAEDFFAQVQPEEAYQPEEPLHVERQPDAKPYEQWLNEFFIAPLFSRELMVDRMVTDTLDRQFRAGHTPATARRVLQVALQNG